MSRNSAAAFMRAVAEDAAILARFLAVASDHGYRFDVEELSDAELDAAAGGVVDKAQPVLMTRVEVTFTTGS